MFFAGETGIGKTTLIETLFNLKLEPACGVIFNPPCGTPSGADPPVSIRVQTLNLHEGRVQLRVTVAETVRSLPDASESLMWPHVRRSKTTMACVLSC